MKHIILCDLDGTLADCSHRLHYIQQTPKNWTAFFAACGDDKPIEPIVEFIKKMWDVGYDIWITSGRSNECRRQTVEWLQRYKVPCFELIMRKAGDHTDDGELKASWVKSGKIPKDEVFFALDDRNRVVKAWRDLGITCFQVNDGDF